MLVSETTVALLDSTELQPMGNAPLRGKQQPIAVFTALAEVATVH